MAIKRSLNVRIGNDDGVDGGTGADVPDGDDHDVLHDIHGTDLLLGGDGSKVIAAAIGIASQYQNFRRTLHA